MAELPYSRNTIDTNPYDGLLRLYERYIYPEFAYNDLTFVAGSPESGSTTLYGEDSMGRVRSGVLHFRQVAVKYTTGIWECAWHVYHECDIKFFEDTSRFGIGLVHPKLMSWVVGYWNTDRNSTFAKELDLFSRDPVYWLAQADRIEELGNDKLAKYMRECMTLASYEIFEQYTKEPPEIDITNEIPEWEDFRTYE